MDVREAVARRRSVRAFLPDPVDPAVVRRLVDAARQAPSGGNLQPWRLHVLAGGRLAAFKALVRERAAASPRGEAAEYAVYPPDLWEPYRSRRFQVGEALYAALGVRREDKGGRLRQFARNYEFFGAPVGMFVLVHRGMGPPQWADLGLFLQTLMLLAVEEGLDSCAQEAWSVWAGTASGFLPIPDGYMLFCGLALGRADDAHAANRWRAPRAPLDEIATFELD